MRCSRWLREMREEVRGFITERLGPSSASCVSQGLTGLPGPKGMAGYPGPDGPPGLAGFAGFPGMAGHKVCVCVGGWLRLL